MCRAASDCSGVDAKGVKYNAVVHTCKAFVDILLALISNKLNSVGTTANHFNT